MMNRFTVWAALLFLAGSAGAGIYNQAEQQARKVSAEVTARDERAIGASAPQRPAAQSAPKPNPVLQATLANIAALRADFSALGNADDTNAVAARKRDLIHHLAAAAFGAKPSQATIVKLADDLATALANQTQLQAKDQRLAQEIHALFNSAHLSPTQKRMVLRDVQKTLSDGGASTTATTAVVRDLKTIVTQTQ